MRGRRLALLGAGGRLGGRILDVAGRLGWDVVAVGMGHDPERAHEILSLCRPELVWLPGDFAGDLAALGARAVRGQEGYRSFLDLDADLLVVAVPSVEPLELCLRWLESGRELVVASKELLVAGGHLLGSRVRILDSELSALTQLLEVCGDRVSGALLPASGGRLWGAPEATVLSARPEEVLGHPVWDMGPKITVDSATFLNKTFEVLAAETSLGLEPGSVRVAVHRECVIHAAVAVDGGWILAARPPEMDWAVRWALGAPSVIPGDFPFGSVRFERVKKPFSRALALLDRCRDPFLRACLVGADGAFVEAFLGGEIPLGTIWDGLEAVVASCERLGARCALGPPADAAAVLAAVQTGRETARRWLLENLSNVPKPSKKSEKNP